MDVSKQLLRCSTGSIASQNSSVFTTIEPLIRPSLAKRVDQYLQSCHHHEIKREQQRTVRSLFRSAGTAGSYAAEKAISCPGSESR